MGEIDFLKTVYVNEDEVQEASVFFDTMTDEQRTDIFAAFNEYEKPDAYVITDIYYYHLFRFYKNAQWNDANLRRLSSNYILNKWVIYGKSLYAIAHPNKPISRELIKNDLQPFLVSAFGEETSSLMITNERGQSIRLNVPACRLAELEYTVKEAYREQAQKINSGFTYYKEEIGLWLEDTFRIKPQLSGFVDWMLNHKKARGFNMKVTETERTADYVKADLEFDFTPLYSLKGDVLKSDLINYCKFVREECKKMATAPTDTNEEKKKIQILPESIEPIYKALAPYFQGKNAELWTVLEGGAIREPLHFNGNANQLTHVFWLAKKRCCISDTNNKICEWILNNFRYSGGREFKKDSVEKDLNTQETRCKKPLPNLNF